MIITIFALFKDNFNIDARPIAKIIETAVFPYFVFVNGKITRLNHIKLSENVIKHENELKKIAEEFYKGNNKNIDLSNLTDEIKNDLKLFLFTSLKN